MPLYDFICPEGHVTERLGPFSLDLVACACGKPAHRAEVNRIMFGLNGARGERIQDYYDAAAEAKYAYESTDDPEARAATRPDIWRPAFTRARNKLYDKALIGVESERFADPDPHKSAAEVRTEVS
mgnify:CR=1 FL=1